MRRNKDFSFIAELIVIGGMIMFYPVLFITYFVIRFLTFISSVIVILLNILKYKKHHWFIFRSLFIQHFFTNINNKKLDSHRYLKSFIILDSKVNLYLTTLTHADFYETYQRFLPKNMCSISENGISYKNFPSRAYVYHKRDISQLYRLVFLIIVLDHLLNFKKYSYESNIMDFVYFNINILEENKSLSEVFENEYKRQFLLKSL